MSFTVSYSLRVNPSDIQRREGDSDVQFFCYEDNGYQATNVIWVDSQGNTYTEGSTSQGGNTRISVEGNKLIITDLVRSDSGSYRCSRVGNPNVSAVGDLLVTAPPKFLSCSLVQEIEHEKTAVINCKVDRGNPLADIYWLNGTQIIDGSFNPRFTIVESGLQIDNVSLTDEGVYTCYIHNKYGAQTADIHAAFRAVPQFVDPNVELDLVRPFGHFVNLDCSAVGAPSPNYTWTVPPNSHSAQSPVQNKARLTALLGDASDVGEYTCAVDNGVSTITRTFTIASAVNLHPKQAEYSLIVDTGASTNINCTVHGLPLPSLTWSLFTNGLEKRLSNTQVSMEEGDGRVTSVLTQKFKLSDFPQDCSLTIVCNAHNAYSTSQQQFVVAPRDRKVCTATNPTLPSLASGPPVSGKDTYSSFQESDTSSKGSDGKSTFIVAVSVIGGVLLFTVFGACLLLAFFVRLNRRFRNADQASKAEAARSPQPRAGPVLADIAAPMDIYNQLNHNVIILSQNLNPLSPASPTSPSFTSSSVDSATPLLPLSHKIECETQPAPEHEIQCSCHQLQSDTENDPDCLDSAPQSPVVDASEENSDPHVRHNVAYQVTRKLKQQSLSTSTGEDAPHLYELVS